ncbi:MAG: hypothetical protein U0835_19490, partial [Isosphaeraceae bacterium]
VDQAEWDDDARSVRGCLVDVLLDRAYLLSNKYEKEREARSDALAAYRLAPRALRVIHVLSQVTVFLAQEMIWSGQSANAEALLKEAEDCLSEGDRLFPDNADLAKCRASIADLRRRSATPLREVLKKIQEDLPALEQPPLERRLSEAKLLEAGGRFEDAAKVYHELAASHPRSEVVRAAMAWCYRTWLLQMLNQRELDAPLFRRVVLEARERCPGSNALSDIMADFDEREAAGD